MGRRGGDVEMGRKGEMVKGRNGEVDKLIS